MLSCLYNSSEAVPLVERDIPWCAGRLLAGKICEIFVHNRALVNISSSLILLKFKSNMTFLSSSLFLGFASCSQASFRDRGVNGRKRGWMDKNIN